MPFFYGFHYFLGAQVTGQPFATSAIQNEKFHLQNNAAGFSDYFQNSEHFHDAFF